MKKYLSIFLLCISLPLMGYQYNLSICMIFQDEAPYLREWIEFHHLLGVEHFYLYNNLSQDNYKEVLKPYIDKRLVELIEWPYASNNVQEWDKIQVNAYNDALGRAKSKSKWLAILDSDEFLFPTTGDSLVQFLAKFDKVSGVGGICVSWVMYGTSGVEKIPEDKLLIETLVYSTGSGCDHYKSIVRPKRVSHICSPHFASYKKGYWHASPSNKPINPPYIEIEKARINHYWTRDEWYLNNFKIPRRLIWDTDLETCKLWAGTFNNVYDTSIFRFIEPLRARMK